MAYDGSIKIDTKIDTAGFSGGIEKLKSIAKTGCAAVATSLTAVTAGIVAAATASVQVGSEFEAAMSRVSAISGATGQDLEKLKDQAIQLGADTAFSAKEAAAGMENLASAGFNTNEIMSAMPGMLDLAASAGEDLASSADIAASTLRGFGLQASDASHVADVLAKNAADTNAAVADTGEAMKYIAPLAKSAGISFEETAAAIGIMADNGIKGGQAGTTLRGALSRLAKPTDQMAAVMDDLNLKFYDSDGKMKSLSEQCKMLKSATAEMTDEQKNQAIITLYGQESLSGMLALMNTEEGKLEDLTESYKNADGAAADMAATMQDNLKSGMEQLGGSLETLGIKIYEEMQTPLKEAANAGTEYVNRLTEAFADGGFEGLIAEAGAIFGELAAKAAEAAPKMVDAAISFLDSFIQGVAKNSGKLISAATQITKTIVDNLIRLLPAQIQKPVRDCVDTIAKSFNNGGLKKAINTVKTILENLGKQATRLAKIILPPLGKAIDFVADNIDILIPLLVAAVAAYKAMQIVNIVTGLITAHTAAITTESLATAASTGAITLKQIAVGVLTGEIGLATAAQYAWNIAMTANPIGIVIMAVAALTAGLIALCTTQEHAKSSTELLEESEARLEESTDKLGSSYETIGGKMSDFYSDVDNAKNILDDFDDSIIMSNDKQQELADAMDSTQGEITAIATTASEKRRQLTDVEVQRLDDLFKKMNELTEQELAIEEAKQEVATTRADALAKTHDGTLKDYEEYALSLAKTAEDTRANVIDKADSQYTEKLALYKQLLGTSSEYDQKWYDEQVSAAEKDYNKSIDTANKKAADTLDILQRGYYDRAEVLQDSTKQLQQYSDDEKKLKESHDNELKRIEEEYNTKYKELKNSNLTDIEKGNNAESLLYDKQEKEKSENTDFNDKITQLRNKQQKILDDKNYQNQLTGFLGLMGLYETYSGKTNEKSKEIVKAFSEPMEKLPDETKKKFSDALQGANDGLEEKKFSLYDTASNIASGVVNLFKGIFDEHSPSKVFKKIFKYALEGGEIGLDNEAPRLYKTAEKVGDTFTAKLKAHVKTDGLIDKMRSAVVAGTSRVAANLTANIVHDVNVTNDDNNKKVVLQGDIVNKIDVDGREVAVATAPYMSEELEWIGG